MNTLKIALAALLLPIAGLCQLPKVKLPDFEHNHVCVAPEKFLSKTEVSNMEFKAFLDDLDAKGLTDKTLAYKPDDSVWVRDLAFNDPYAKYYFHHEAFLPYPVVGVSYEAATAYCEWLSEKHGPLTLKGQDGKKQTVRVKFRLPTEAEWLEAAGANQQKDSVFIRWYPGRIYYPRDHKGTFRFNHKLGKGDYAGYAGGKGLDWEGYMITAPVNSFPADEHLGLHNMAGNVAEMLLEKGRAKGGSWTHLQDDCRMDAVNTYESPTAWLGFRIIAEVVHETAGN